MGIAACRDAMKPGIGLLAFAAIALGTGRPAPAAEPVQNWFGDPFFQITHELPDCPLPAGPFTDESDRLLQTHRRAEKGTTCWLAKECDRPNAYAYDRDIAAAVQAAMQTGNPFPQTTLWVTVQGRVVYVEGCAAREAQTADVEAFMRGLPHVQQAIAILRTDPSARPPYRLRDAGASGNTPPR